VYRRGPGGKEFCGPVQPDEFTLELIRQRYGGGAFDFRIVKGRKYVKGKSARIAGPLVNLATRIPTEDTRERDTRREAEEEERRERLAGLSVADQLLELRRDMRDMLGALRNPPQAAQNANPVMMALELSKNMQSMMRPYVDALQAKKEERDPADMVELIRLGMELAEGRQGARDPYAGVIKEFGIPLLKMLSPGATAPTPPEAAPIMPEPTTPLEALRPWLPTLIHWATRGADPRLRADFIVDEIPDGFSDMLAQFVSGPEALTQFLNAFPEAMPFRVWFEGLFYGLRVAYGIIVEEEEAAAPGTPVVGGPSN